MDEVVKRLSEIENISNRIIEEASARKKSLTLDNEKRISGFDKEIDTETTLKIAALTEKLDRQLSDELSKLRDKTDAELTHITEQYHSSHRELAQELLKKLLGA